MVSVEKVIVLYDIPKQSGDKVDLFKLVKFLNSLNGRISLKISSAEEFYKIDKPGKFIKFVLFLRDAEKIVETVEDVRKRFDPEKGAALKIITTDAGKEKLGRSSELVKAEDIFTVEELDKFQRWFPEILMFLFGVTKKKPDLQKSALFLFDNDDEVERAWFNMMKAVLNACGGKRCVSMDEVEALAADHIDYVVILSNGEGLAMFQKHEAAIVQCVLDKNIQCLVVTNNTQSTVVEQLKKQSENTSYECDDDLYLGYKVWTSMLLKMSLIDINDVSKPRREHNSMLRQQKYKKENKDVAATDAYALKVLKIIGIVLAVVIFGIPAFVVGTVILILYENSLIVMMANFE